MSNQHDPSQGQGLLRTLGSATTVSLIVVVRIYLYGPALVSRLPHGRLLSLMCWHVIDESWRLIYKRGLPTENRQAKAHKVFCCGTVTAEVLKIVSHPHSGNFNRDVCGLVVRVSGYRSRGSGFDSRQGKPKCSEKICSRVTSVRHKIPHDQTRVWTRAVAVGSQRLTAWAMAPSSHKFN
jgi:hypothetical protein